MSAIPSDQPRPAPRQAGPATAERAGWSIPHPLSLARVVLREAVSELRCGRPVLLLHREGCALVAAAHLATPSFLEFLEETTGSQTRLAVPEGTVRIPAPFNGVSPLSSPANRAYAIQRLLHRSTTPGPDGAVALALADPGGVLVRPGVAEAACDLVRLAELGHAALLLELSDCRDSPARNGSRFPGREFTTVSITDLSLACTTYERPVERVIAVDLPTVHGRLETVGYEVPGQDTEFVALIHGEVAGQADVPVSVHQGCLLGDALGACPCGCGEILRDALDNLAARPRGILIRLQADESTFFHAEQRPDPASAGLALQVLQDLGPQSVVLVDTPEPLRRWLHEHCGPFAR